MPFERFTSAPCSMRIFSIATCPVLRSNQQSGAAIAGLFINRCAAIQKRLHRLDTILPHGKDESCEPTVIVSGREEEGQRAPPLLLQPL